MKRNYLDIDARFLCDFVKRNMHINNDTKKIILFGN